MNDGSSETGGFDDHLILQRFGNLESGKCNLRSAYYDYARSQAYRGLGIGVGDLDGDARWRVFGKIPSTRHKIASGMSNPASTVSPWSDAPSRLAPSQF